ncbi:HpcH/HpaI aldolase/citrate lyase family protein [Phyllobacterium bourgognense]|uniref:Citrate lyase subunit beta/citryl-CoA lyase n=1 Tax=Phyllobacterium bourgognense TaxID=314236 RepID=A0A368YW04_9HYPH|nr:CoA ester lyase [Phyllobacterium bourgognense]RCW84385.1 citrate lyase subunit beta/citryl-CoA lyase [Phyllobacterium bourgognense]
MIRTFRPRRSALYVPASNNRALAKAASLDADVIIFDLEDAVAPDVKEDAREALREYFVAHPQSKAERVVRVNGLASEWGAEDLFAARACRPDAILLPKVETPQDITGVAEILEETDASEGVRLWAMIETPRGILNADEIAELGLRSTARLDCFVIGTNDISKETGTKGRGALMPWLMQVLLCAKAGKLDVIDGVYNDFSDLDGFAAECIEAVRMGFDGKSLIHPSQIETANASFLPDAASVAQARMIVEAFSNREKIGKGVTSLNGKMVERLHLEMAEKLLEKLDIIGKK